MKLKRGFVASVIYHNIFDYPLTRQELERWETNKDLRSKNQELRIRSDSGFYFLEGRESMVAKRLVNEKASKKKLKIAKRAGKLLARIPLIKFVGITGSLAMSNSAPGSDIDLMIVASKDTLWTTRLITYILLLAFSFRLRRPGLAEENDRLCLNMWLDECDLVFTKRNIFTAHEIAQIVPLVNKDKVYERLLAENRWIVDYWPRSVEILNYEPRTTNYGESRFLGCIVHSSLFAVQFFEPLAYTLQHLYMKRKITREIVTPTRAFFHPNDWSGKVVLLLGKK